MNNKFLLIIAQTTGYVIAKWAGIKIVSEIRPEQRIKSLLGLILFGELMLLLFGIENGGNGKGNENQSCFKGFVPSDVSHFCYHLVP